MSTNDSYVLTAEKNGIKVKSTLHGSITPERIATAKQELAHRLEQLQPIVKMTDAEELRRMQREDRGRREENESDDFYDDADYEDWRDDD